MIELFIMACILLVIYFFGSLLWIKFFVKPIYPTNSEQAKLEREREDFKRSNYRDAPPSQWM